MTDETPDTVHGRLLESVHLSGYSFERACGELEWLLDDDRWKRIGRGFDDIRSFLATLQPFDGFRDAVDRRERIARRLKSLESSERATARVLGISKTQVRRDLGLDASGPNGPTEGENIEQTDTAGAANGPNGPQSWFQSDADPTREAKRITRNAEREIERAQTRDDRPPHVPAGVYRLIYADPPWRYEHVVTENRAIENQYPTMSLEEICAYDVPAAEDAVLFLWATSPKLAEAMTVIAAWRFDYRTCAVWDKGSIGMGYYFRQQHELLLVAARGSLPVPDPTARPSSVVHAPRGKHSAKPARVFDLLEAMYPEFTADDRIELFSRCPREGWASSSNEPEAAHVSRA